jgi:hypothetical protein
MNADIPGRLCGEDGIGHHDPGNARQRSEHRRQPCFRNYPHRGILLKAPVG